MDQQRSIDLVSDLPMRAIDILIEHIRPQAYDAFWENEWGSESFLVDQLRDRGLLTISRSHADDGSVRYTDMRITNVGLDVVRALKDFYLDEPILPEDAYHDDNLYGMF